MGRSYVYCAMDKAQGLTEPFFFYFTEAKTHKAYSLLDVQGAICSVCPSRTFKTVNLEYASRSRLFGWSDFGSQCLTAYA